MPQGQPPTGAVKAAPDYLPQVRAERLIASGRACLVLFALGGVLVDPLGADTFSNNTLRLLIVYSGYAAVYWYALAHGIVVTRRLAIATHLVDLAMAVALTVMTRGSGSPYFLLFTFLLLCGVVRWAAAGAMWTGVTVMAAYALVGLATAAGWIDDPFELYRFTVRFGLLLAMTVVLMQLGRYQRALHDDLHQIVHWPRLNRESLDEILLEALAHAARLLRVSEVVLAWRFHPEGALELARYADGRLERAGDGRTQPWTALAALEIRESILVDRTHGTPRTIGGVEQPRELTEHPENQRLLADHGARTAIAAPLAGADCSGWVLLLDRAGGPLSVDDLMIAGIVASETARSLERWAVIVRARQAALAEERLRVARDLHDGILQSLTGCRLDLSSAATETARTMPVVADQLTALERALAHEQQQLREFIQHLRPAAAAGRAPQTSLRDLCQRVQRQWRIAVTLHPGSDEATPAALTTEILLLCHEAIVNAARHARAASVDVFVESTGTGVRLMVADDGCGFPLHGRFDAAQLAVLGWGPRSLRERAEANGGTLVLVSTPQGSTIEIRLPAHAEAPCAS